MIPYHYLPDKYSTFLQALCREYLTSHINFQASRTAQLKTKEAEEKNRNGKGWDKGRSEREQKKQIKAKSSTKEDERVCSSYLGEMVSNRPQNKTT